MSKIKNGGLDQYGAGSLEREQFGIAGVEGVNVVRNVVEQTRGASADNVACHFDRVVPEIGR